MCALIYGLSECDPREPPGAAYLVEGHFGASGIDYGPVRRAMLVQVDSVWRIRLPHGLRGPDRNRALAMCLAEWHLVGGAGNAEHRDVCALARHILLPPEAVALLRDELGLTAARIASILRIPRDVVDARLGDPLDRRSSGRIRLIVG